MHKFSSAGFARKSVAALMAASMVASFTPGLALADTSSNDGGSAVVTLASSATLDPANLQDGTYTVDITMKNASTPSQNSMSDSAVDKPITITVTGGQYYATVNMHGIEIKLGQTPFFGYLKELYYWDGSSFQPVTYDSYYDGVVDSFNDDNRDGVADYLYPKQMTFPLVNKNAGDQDGYVRMQVFVPIMESISAGSGTQQALMSIDWSTLQRVGGSDPVTPVTPSDPTTPDNPTDPTDDSQAQRDAALSELNGTIANAKAVSNSDGTYTAASFKALTDAIAAGETAAADSSATKDQLDAAAKTITDAQAALVKQVDADRVASLEALNAAVKDARGVSNSDGTYTTASFKALSDAIAAGEKTAADSSSTKSQLDSAAKAITDAKAALVTVAQAELQDLIKSLNESIANAKTISNADGTYTADSFKALSDAIASAESAAANANVTKGQIDDAAKALTDAQAALVKQADADRAASLEALNAAVKDAQDVSNADGTYTAASFKALSDAIAAGEKTAADSSSTKDQLDSAAKAITDAKAALVTVAEAERQASLETLNAAIKDAKAITNADGAYTEASFSSFASVLESAERVAANEYATKTLLDTTVQTLSQAREGLVTTRSISLEALDKVLESAKAVSNSDGAYTAESYKALTDAIAAAESAAADSSTSAAQLDAAAKAIADAQSGLVKVTTATVSGVTYEIAGTGATVTGGSKSASKATVAATVKIGGKTYKVRSIANGAFKSSKKLASVTIGKNVTAIGAQAFKGCGKLKTVTFKGKAVKSIGKQAFKGIAKKATFKAPASKKAAYKKLVKKAGAPKGFKVK